jgi:restriction system protein
MIPDFQTVMRPLLELASDGQTHVLTDAFASLATHFQLSEDEREELLPSGKQRRFENRVRWARTYLGKAGLLEAPRRGELRITERGRDLLREVPDAINVGHLERYPEYVEFKNTTRATTEASSNDRSETPEESLETNFQTLRNSLADDVLQRVKSASPQFFEELVVDLLVAMGYGGSRRDAGKAVGRSGDDGIDGIINEDKLGLDVVYLQAKRWQGPVGRPVVQAFAGSLEGHRARKGVLITTSHFTPDATEYVDRIEKKIVLLDGARLAQLMIDHDIGVADVATYKIKRVDLDYFPEPAE